MPPLSNKSAWPTPMLDRLVDWFWLASTLLVALALYASLMYAPSERIMGSVQRIFYFHVGAAMACYLCCAALLFSGVYYLATRIKLSAIVNQAAYEVGLVLCTIVMATGMIWGHAAWNIWFRWEPRLVSFLLLWFVLLAGPIVRRFGNPDKVDAHCAVLSIIGAIMVPIVVFSVKLLPQAAQLHPQVLESEGLKDARFGVALVVSIVAICALSAHLVALRAKIGYAALRKASTH